MDLAVFRELLSPRGSKALQQAADLDPRDETLLNCLQRLRRAYPLALASAALETVRLRRKAAAKFSHADRMFFTAEALEQASSEVVADYRAERFRDFGVVGDLACGIGGDAFSLARTLRVEAIDRDPLRLAMAEANLHALGRGGRARFHLGDLLKMPMPAVAACFLDPDRRADGRRRVSLKHYQPALDAVLRRLPPGFPLGVKLAPAVPREEISSYPAEAEFISVRGELKECVLWFGPLSGAARRATLLPERESLAGSPVAWRPPAAPRRYLYDPDPAVVRADLVGNLAEEVDAHPIDTEIAFLTSNERHATPFAAAYRIDAAFDFQRQRLASHLRSLRVGRITLVKRGSPIDPEVLIRDCKLNGPEHRVVILTRIRGSPSVLIGERI